MTENINAGDEAPEGMRLHSSSEVAVMAISGAMAARAGVMSTSEIAEMFSSFEKSIEANTAEHNAVVLLAIANLAATAYSQLADLTGASPLDLINTNVAFDEAVMDLADKL